MIGTQKNYKMHLSHILALRAAIGDFTDFEMHRAIISFKKPWQFLTQDFVQIAKDQGVVYILVR